MNSIKISQNVIFLKLREQIKDYNTEYLRNNENVNVDKDVIKEELEVNWTDDKSEKPKKKKP